ncbi:GntR family transcriptional regulator [Roseibium sp. CAU 1637]|uniref:GntR family transcriptional regulator n=1 Tax=Roseibium limicola TaxID=2816037 RepID=A0A939EKD7_9HYPH|nr:GntR family transcriptional regulator [Roseibium limicola]MBO0344022.1 GntR family transcriptional regulator [Roseibium limicola]
MTVKESNSWIRIREELLRRINERVWQPGETIPGEAELAEEFGCARTTVNRALRDLAEAGLVTRRRKAGTRVAVNPPHKATFTIPIIREEVEARGSSYSHSLLKREKRPLPTSLHAAFPVGDEAFLLYTETVYFADDRPFMFEERYTNIDATPAFAEAAFDLISPNEWLVQNAPFTTGDLTCYAANAGPALSGLYECQDNTPLFVMERVTFNQTQPITHVRMTYSPGYRLRTGF